MTPMLLSPQFAKTHVRFSEKYYLSYIFKVTKVPLLSECFYNQALGEVVEMTAFRNLIPKQQIHSFCGVSYQLSC